MAINIRRPEVDDIDQLTKHFNETILDIFSREDIQDDDLCSGEMKEKMVFLMEDLDSKGKDRYFLVATVDGEIAGTIAYGPSNELIHECTHGELNDIGEIGTVYVHPKFQKQGIGMKLMNAMYISLISRGVSEYCLDSGYSSAQEIWTRKLGAPEYVSKDHWGTGNDHMVWHKKLDDIHITI